MTLISHVDSRKLILVLTFSTVIQILTTLVPSVGDAHIYRQWLRALAEEGLASAYWDKPIASVDVSGGYYRIDYPPIYPYLLYSEGKFIKKLAPAVFLNDSQLLVLIKTPLILVNAAVAALIFWIVRKTKSSKEALLATSFYAFNPAIIYNTAFWGQSDSLCALLILLSFFLIEQRRPVISWILITLAAFTKPIAYPFALLLVLYTLKTQGIQAFLKACLAASGTAFVVLLPFVWIGRFSAIIHSLFEQPYAAPYISANAHNFWWIIGVGLPWVSAENKIFGSVSYGILGIALFGIFYVLAVWKLFKSTEPHALYFCLASVALVLFILFPYMHSYHLIYFLTFAPLILFTHKPVPLLYVLFSILSFANMLLYDIFFIYLSIPGRFLTMFVSQLSVLSFLYWVLKFYAHFKLTTVKVTVFSTVFLVVTTLPFIAKSANFATEHFLIKRLDSAKISALPNSVDRFTVNIHNDIRPVLYQSPPAEITYQLTLPKRPVLRFGLYIDPAAWTVEKGDGVLFEIAVSRNGSTSTVFSKYIDPKLRVSDRRWHDEEVDLSKYSLQHVTLRLITNAGPENNRNFDWAGWSDPRIIATE